MGLVVDSIVAIRYIPDREQQMSVCVVYLNGGHTLTFHSSQADKLWDTWGKVREELNI